MCREVAKVGAKVDSAAHRHAQTGVLGTAVTGVHLSTHPPMVAVTTLQGTTEAEAAGQISRTVAPASQHATSSQGLSQTQMWHIFSFGKQSSELTVRYCLVLHVQATC